MTTSVERARLALLDREPERALEIVDAALAREPPEPLLRLRDAIIGRIQPLRGRHEHDELAARLLPHDERAQERWLAALVEEERWHEALALARSPERPARLSPSTALSLARALYATGRSRAAIGALTRASAIAGTAEKLVLAEEMMRCGDPHAARALVDSLVTGEPASTDVRSRAAMLALWSGEVPRAVSLAEGRDDHESRLVHAAALLPHDPAASLAIATEATASKPRDHAAWTMRIRALGQLGRVEEIGELVPRIQDAPDAGSNAGARLSYVASGARLGTGHRELLDAIVAQVGPELAQLAGQPVGATELAGDRTLAQRLLERLSFNYGATPTWLGPDGSWRSLPVRFPLRVLAVRTFDLCKHLPPDRVLERFDALAAAYPDRPYPHTHRAELLLWLGRYDEGARSCERALEIDVSTRWAWIGLGAAHVLRGRSAEALEVLAEGLRHSPLGGPLLGVRGEAHLALGDPERAERDLREALTYQETRTGAWLALAKAAWQRGDAATADAIHARLVERLPWLVESARRDLGQKSRSDEQDGAERAALVRHVLEMMRGNRSAGRVTWIPRDGVPRVLTARSLAP